MLTAAPPPGSTVTPPGGTTSPDGINPFSLAYMTSFDEDEASRLRSLPEFAIQQRTWSFPGSPTYTSFSYASVRAEYPLSVGLTGAGKTIAVVDDGFRLSHREFAGKMIRSFGTFSSETHGTKVASIVAGVRDGSGMMGIAPGADLHVSSFVGTTGGLNLQRLADATRDAVEKNAIAQNNSWGIIDAQGTEIPVTELQARVDADPARNVGRALASIVGGSEKAATNYLDSLQAFASRGVVVFAASNDAAATSAGILDGLPTVLPSLAAGWLVAVNAVPTFGADGRVASAARLSAACLQSAPACLVGDGMTLGASAGGDRSYQWSTGTSFVAPQIAGGLAILAEAFPSLPPSDLRKRLLASADNGFYAHSGVTDLGYGVTHGYNSEFGHGFLNLKVALQPIGTVGLPTGATAYDRKTALASAGIGPGAAQGDGIARSLVGRRIAVFDALGADFRVRASALVRSTNEPSGFERRFRSFTAVSGGQRAGFARTALGLTAHTLGPTGNVLSFGSTDLLVPTLGAGFASPGIGALPDRMHGVIPGAVAAAFTRAADLTAPAGYSTTFYAFATPGGEHRATVTGTAFRGETDERLGAGAGVIRTFSFGSADLSVGASVMGENRSALGLESFGALGTSKAASAALDLGAGLRLSDKVAVFASVQGGASVADRDGLLASGTGAPFTAFTAGIRHSAVLSDRDVFTFSVSQPLRAEADRAILSAPSGRTLDGGILWQAIPVNMAPSGRQFDWNAGYEASAATGLFRLAATLSTDAGHVHGAVEVAVMGSWMQRF